MFGFIKLEQERINIYDALTKAEYIRKWFGKEIIEKGEKTIILKERLLNEIDNLTITKEKDEKNAVIWHCVSNEINFTIFFTIEKKKIHVEIISDQKSIVIYLQDWIYIFYRLKELIESEHVNLPNLEYENSQKKPLQLKISINNTKKEVYTRITKKPYINQIFALYPEVDLDNFVYSWGWIEEGPSNLISWIQNSVLIYDFMVDFNFVGYVKWELEELSGHTTVLTLTHKDLDLEGETDQKRAYFSYRNGWLYLLAKVKDLSENSSFSIHFEEELLD